MSDLNFDALAWKSVSDFFSAFGSAAQLVATIKSAKKVILETRNAIGMQPSVPNARFKAETSTSTGRMPHGVREQGQNNLDLASFCHESKSPPGMKHGALDSAEAAESRSKRLSQSQPRQRRKAKGWRRLLYVVLVLAIIGGVGRALLPWGLRKYVNRTLEQSPLYQGKIGAIRVHLWRGAYSIQDIQISKTAGNLPVPFFASKQLDFAIQWDALFHHRIVGRLLMDKPELNFVDAPSKDESQSGVGAPWLQMIRDLFPFKINRAVIRDGTVHFRAFKPQKPVDVYLSDVQGTIENLGNIRNETAPLVATVKASATVMDQAKLDFEMTMDPFSYRPTFHMAARLLGLDVTKLNDLALAYGKFDFKRGWLDLVIQADSNEGQISGYVKPLFRNLKVFSLAQDIKEDNVLQLFWQALVGFVTQVFKNQPRDQFGTLIPFSADVTGGASPDILATIGNILRNAFVRAYLPRLEQQQEMEGLTFEPPDISEAVSPSEAP